MDFNELFERALSVTRRGSDYLQAHCPFPDNHAGGDDSTPSFRVNLHTGDWRCYGCGVSGTAAEFKRMMERPIVPSSEVEVAHQALLADPHVLEYLDRSKLIDRATAIRYKLGFEPIEGWIWIPILDSNRVCVNVRKFDFTRTKQCKYTHYAKGYAHEFCWPTLGKSDDDIVLCEGEFKALVLRRFGYNAQSLPSGVESFNKETLPLYKGRRVYVLFDAGGAARRAAERLAQRLEFYAREILFVRFDGVEGSPKGKADDIIDYLIATADEQSYRARLVELFARAIRFDPSPLYTAVQLSDATNAAYTGRRISTNVRVVGKDLAPYTLPRVVRITCSPQLDDARRKCATCPMSEGLGSSTLVLDHEHPQRLISLAGMQTKQLKTVLLKLAGVPDKCPSVRVNIKEYQNLEEVTVTPSVRNLHRFGSHVLRQAWYLGAGLKTNNEYGFYSIATANPSDQHATQLVLKADPAQSDLDSWENTMHEELKIFQNLNYDDYVRDLEANVMKNLRGIGGLVEAIDYVYHSVLTFDFDGYRIPKGWVEGLILGDPRLGKTTAAEALSQHYQAGEVLSGEQCTMAGLLGSLQQVNKRWILVWGKLPQLDRRLGVVDETSGLSTDTLGLLSGVRSSGIAQLIKVCEEKTAARARLLWMSNCRRQGAQLADYTFGVEAVQELFGAAEDVARLDFAYTIGRADLPPDVIYSARPVCPHRYTSRLCSNLVMWAWTRRPEDVCFTPVATRRCLELARKMGDTYSSVIPLVKAAEQRNILAKLAVAAAARRYSTPDGQRLLVLSDHVEMANDFLERCWCRSSLGYDAYSQVQKKATLDKQSVKARLLELPNPSFFISWALDARTITVRDLGVFDMQLTEAGDFIATLAKNRCLSKGRGSAYHKTAAFISLLKELCEDSSFMAMAQAKDTTLS